ncbi:MAG: alpha-2-macroglobulin family protein [Cytophagaceae bacterium]
MRLFALLTGLTFLPLLISAQKINDLFSPNSQFAYIYIISSAEAKEIYEQPKISPSYIKYFHTLVDSVLYINKHKLNLPNGQYIITYLKEGQVQYELKGFSSIKPHRIYHNGKSFLFIKNTRGQNIPKDSLTLFLRNEYLKYNEEIKAFEIPKGKEGILTITSNKETSFYSISKTDYDKKVILKLNNLTDKIKYSLDNIFTSDYYGYLALNKPVYKPGDTLKLKAYIVNKKRKHKKKTEIVIKGKDYKDKPTTIATLKPVNPGSYLMEYILPDSLRLDKYYNIGISNKGKKYKFNFSNQFKIEEYKLNQNIISVKSEKKEYLPDDSIKIKIYTHDNIGSPIDDAEINLIIETESIHTFQEDITYVPFELYKATLTSDNSGITQITLPDSIFKNCDLTAKCKIQIKSAGELYDTLFKIRINKLPEFIKAEIVDGKIFAQYLYKGRPTEKKGQMVISTGADTLISKIISFPYTDFINYSAARYSFSENKVKEHIIVPWTEPFLLENTSNKDSIKINLTNYENADVYYNLYEGYKLIRYGKADQTKINIARKRRKNYSIQIQYLCRNEIRDRTIQIGSDKNSLKIQTNIPDYARPGSRHKVRVQITDKKDKPVRGVNLTSSALNEQFKIKVIPSISVKESPESYYTESPRQSVYKASINVNNKFSQTPDDSTFANNFYFPDKNGFRYYHTIKDTAGQLAIYIINKNKSEKIFYIEADDKPVYIDGIGTNNSSLHNPGQNYSITLNSGWHKIGIRTFDKYFTIDSVLIKSGKKLVLSFNPENKSEVVKSIPAPTTIRGTELGKLNQNVYHIKNLSGRTLGIGYTNNTQWIQNGKNAFVGPFYSDSINIFYYDTQRSVKLSNGHSYFVYNNDVKDTIITKKGIFNGKLYNANEYISNLSKDKILSPGVVAENLNKKPESKLEPDFMNNTITTYGNGSYYIQKDTINFIAVTFINNNKTDTYGIGSQAIYNIPSGTYKLILMDQQFRYYTKDSVNILPNTITLDIGNNITPYNQEIPERYFTFYKYDFKKSTPLSSFNPVSGKQNTYYSSSNNNHYNNYNSNFDNRKWTFNKKNRYKGLGISVNTATLRSEYSGAIQDIRPGIGVFVLKKYTPRLAARPELNYYILKGQNTYSGTSFRNRIAEIALNFTFDLFENRGRYIKRPDYNFYLVAGAGLYYNYQQQYINGNWRHIPAYSNAGINIPVGLGFNYKLSKNWGVDIEGNYKLYLTDNLDGMAGNSNDNALFINIRALYIIASRVMCPRFSDGGVAYSITYNSSPKVELQSIQNDKAPWHPNKEMQMENSNRIRQNFSDYAWWSPDLMTNKNGTVDFEISFPDDITSWRSYLIALSNKKQFGAYQKTIKTFNPVTSKINLPDFLIEGDETEVFCKTTNFTPETIFLEQKLLSNQDTIFNISDTIQSNKKYTGIIKAKNQDTLNLSFISLNKKEIADGEKRIIPVFQQGVLESNGSFSVITKDSTFQLVLPGNNSTIRIENNFNQSLLEEIEHLEKYPHYCMEQTASKLNALLLKRQILIHTEKLFSQDKDIKDLISRLQKGQHADGSWGWWPGSQTSYHITSYVVNTLTRASKAGYNIPELSGAIKYMNSEFNSNPSIHSLYQLSEINTTLNYDSLLNILSVNNSPLSIHNKVKIIKIKQANNLPYRQELQSINLGEVLRNKENYSVFNSKTELMIDLYKLYKEENNVKNLEVLTQYFLSMRSNGKWRNTYESASILNLLVPEYLNTNSNPQKTEVSIKGSSEKKIYKFPYKENLSGDSIIQISTKNNTPLFISIHQKKWNNQPIAKENIFRIQTSFIQNKKTTDTLISGSVATLQVRIASSEMVEYLMVEIPIPAGCHYGEKIKGTGFETYREYKKDKIIVFFERFYPGTEIVKIELLPVYKGKFTLNPSKAESMYFPTIYGNNTIKTVIIK